MTQGGESNPHLGVLDREDCELCFMLPLLLPVRLWTCTQGHVNTCYHASIQPQPACVITSGALVGISQTPESALGL